MPCVSLIMMCPNASVVNSTETPLAKRSLEFIGFSVAGILAQLFGNGRIIPTDGSGYCQSCLAKRTAVPQMKCKARRLIGSVLQLRRIRAAGWGGYSIGAHVEARCVPGAILRHSKLLG